MTHHQDQRWIATPSTAVTKAILDHVDDPAFLARFDAKVDKGFSDDDCWIWTAGLSDEGYGVFRVKRHSVRAHRVSWMLTHRMAVPDETPLLDHLGCLGRWCVNPRHLEPVTNEENTRRGTGIGTLNQRANRSIELIRRLELREAGAF